MSAYKRFMQAANLGIKKYSDTEIVNMLFELGGNLEDAPQVIGEIVKDQRKAELALMCLHVALTTEFMVRKCGYERPTV
jgi:hypothetical protein